MYPFQEFMVQWDDYGLVVDPEKIFPELYGTSDTGAKDVLISLVISFGASFPPLPRYGIRIILYCDLVTDALAKMKRMEMEVEAALEEEKPTKVVSEQVQVQLLSSFPRLPILLLLLLLLNISHCYAIHSAVSSRVYLLLTLW
jgi:hypothetical protein